MSIASDILQNETSQRLIFSAWDRYGFPSLIVCWMSAVIWVLLFHNPAAADARAAHELALEAVAAQGAFMIEYQAGLEGRCADAAEIDRMIHGVYQGDYSESKRN